MTAMEKSPGEGRLFRIKPSLGLTDVKSLHSIKGRMIMTMPRQDGKAGRAGRAKVKAWRAGGGCGVTVVVDDGGGGRATCWPDRVKSGEPRQTGVMDRQGTLGRWPVAGRCLTGVTGR